MPGDLLDFASLKLSPRPNQFLVAPDGLCQNAEPHEISPVFPVPPPVMFEAWRKLVTAAPRTMLKAADKRSGQIEAVQHSALFKFRDRITFAAFAAGQDHSSLAVYSRSLVGYSDLGANKARIRRWLEILNQSLASG